MTLNYLVSIINTQETCVLQSMYLEIGVPLLKNSVDPSSWSLLADLLGTGWIPGWELVWHGASSYKNCVCLNKNKSSAKISWYLWYEAWKLAIPRPPQIFWFCPPFIQHVLSDQCYNYRFVENVLCGLNPYKDLAVKTAAIIKGLFLKESFHKNAFETMQVGYFWNIGTRATCSEFLFPLYREAITSSDSKNKTKPTSPSNYSLETAWKKQWHL